MGRLRLDPSGKLIGLAYCLCGHLNGSHAIGQPHKCCMEGCPCRSCQHDAALALVHAALLALARSAKTRESREANYGH